MTITAKAVDGVATFEPDWHNLITIGLKDGVVWDNTTPMVSIDTGGTELARLCRGCGKILMETLLKRQVFCDPACRRAHWRAGRGK